MAVREWHCLKLDSELFYWLAVDIEEMEQGGRRKPITLLSISRRETGGGGVGRPVPRGAQVTEADVIATIRELRRAGGDVEP